MFGNSEIRTKSVTDHGNNEGGIKNHGKKEGGIEREDIETQT